MFLTYCIRVCCIIFLFTSILYSKPIETINGDLISITSNSPYVIFNKTKYTPIYKNNFLIPIHYKIKQKTHNLKTKTKNLKIRVSQGDYKKEVLRVSKSKTNLTTKQIKRARKESALIKSIYKKTIPRQWSKDFIYPLNTKHTSLYGNSRIFNNKIKSYHSGLDFRAPIGTDIKASNDGIVEFSGDLFFSGNCVVVNHGMGVFTLYAHLSSPSVAKGVHIKRGDIIGKSGMSGRSTGPHLHFGVILNSIKINPISFINKINQLHISSTSLQD